MISISAGEEREPFDFKQGDILILLESEPEGAPKKSEWVKGQNERTGRKGIFPLEAVYVVPTLEKPGADVTVSVLYIEFRFLCSR